MTVTLELTPKLVQTLNDAASDKPMDDHTLRETLREVLASFQPPLFDSGEATLERIAGLNANDVDWISDDFDDPLPDSFWLGGLTGDGD